MGFRETSRRTKRLGRTGRRTDIYLRPVPRDISSTTTVASILMDTSSGTEGSRGSGCVPGDSRWYGKDVQPSVGITEDGEAQTPSPRRLRYQGFPRRERQGGSR
jgi:hypothetical protein